MNAWKPITDDEFAVFLEDDTEVSPYFFEYLLMNMNRYLYRSDIDLAESGEWMHGPDGSRPVQESSWGEARTQNSTGSFGGSTSSRTASTKALNANLIGFSLYTPRWDEIHNPSRYWLPNQVLPGSSLFLFQIPCSWGALFFPWTWREFSRYYHWKRSDVNSERFDSANIVPRSRSNRWTRSWKRQLIDYMFARGWYMLYASFPKQVSFSTNHREPGAHTGKGGREVEADSFHLSRRKMWHYTVSNRSFDFC